MEGNLFCFDPAKHAKHFASEGYVHVRGGVTESFYRKVVPQVEHNMKSKTMKEFAIGDKQQAMYAFPDDGIDYITELCRTVGAVVGVDPNKIVLSERHIKGYEASAAAEPLAHKDRFASEFSVGISVHVKEGSTLVLYPYDELDINSFNTSVQLRASLSPDRYPEAALKKGKRVEIKDAAKDLVIFRGHKIWHLRSNPALTTMLYFKMNSFNCDPMGEDRRTPEIRTITEGAVELNDGELDKRVVMIGRRVDFFHRYLDRNWTEIPGVVLFGEKHFSMDEEEMKLVRAIDGKKDVAAIFRAMSERVDRTAVLKMVRRLAKRGVIDLLPVSDPSVALK